MPPSQTKPALDSIARLSFGSIFHVVFDEHLFYEEQKNVVRITLGLCARAVRFGLCAGLCAGVVRRGVVRLVHVR